MFAFEFLKNFLYSEQKDVLKLCLKHAVLKYKSKEILEISTILNWKKKNDFFKAGFFIQIYKETQKFQVFPTYLN